MKLGFRPLVLGSLVAALGVGGVVVSPASAQAAEEKTYAMLCRGGGGMRVEMDRWTKNSGATWLRLEWRFQRGNAGVQNDDASRIQPGMCSWRDRAMNSDEPTKLVASKVRDPLSVATFMRAVACTHDEHCYFVVHTRSTGRTLVLESDVDITIGHVE